MYVLYVFAYRFGLNTFSAVQFKKNSAGVKQQSKEEKSKKETNKKKSTSCSQAINSVRRNSRSDHNGYYNVEVHEGRDNISK